MDNAQSLALSVCLDFGEAMMKSGAEIGRVEDSLRRLGRAFGARETEVFAITACLILTLRFPEGEQTGMRRVRDGGQTDFTCLRRLNDLSRRCADHSLPPETVSEELDTICKARVGGVPIYLGSALAAGSFAVFFGGGPSEGLLAALMGLFICLMQRNCAARFPNKVLFLFTVSLLSGLAICATDRLFSFADLQIDHVMIGDIMLLIPGVATTLAVRDLFIGDTISGFTKLLECILHALSMAAGFILATVFFGR